MWVGEYFLTLFIVATRFMSYGNYTNILYSTLLHLHSNVTLRLTIFKIQVSNLNLYVICLIGDGTFTDDKKVIWSSCKG